MIARTIPAGRCIVFTHVGPVSTLRETIHAAWTRWLPRAGHAPAGTTDFERYDGWFDPVNGGGADLYIPVR